jgi:hypothetical protein
LRILYLTLAVVVGFVFVAASQWDQRQWFSSEVILEGDTPPPLDSKLHSAQV